jgi:hypothetical protein
VKLRVATLVTLLILGGGARSQAQTKDKPASGQDLATQVQISFETAALSPSWQYVNAASPQSLPRLALTLRGVASVRGATGESVNAEWKRETRVVLQYTASTSLERNAVMQAYVSGCAQMASFAQSLPSKGTFVLTLEGSNLSFSGGGVVGWKDPAQGSIVVDLNNPFDLNYPPLTSVNCAVNR